MVRDQEKEETCRFPTGRDSTRIPVVRYGTGGMRRPVKVRETGRKRGSALEGTRETEGPGGRMDESQGVGQGERMWKEKV